MEIRNGVQELNNVIIYNKFLGNLCRDIEKIYQRKGEFG